MNALEPIILHGTMTKFCSLLSLLCRAIPHPLLRGIGILGLETSRHSEGQSLRIKVGLDSCITLEFAQSFILIYTAEFKEHNPFVSIPECSRYFCRFPY